MNSRLENLVKNLMREKFKCLCQEFGGERLELLKQKKEYIGMNI